jgi:hypothetical protein
MARSTAARRRTAIDMPYSLQLNGTTGYSTHGNVYDKERTDSFSVSFWIRTTDVTAVMVGRLRVAGTLTGWEVANNTTLGVSLNIISTGTNLINTRFASQYMKFNKWVHITFTYNGSSDASGVIGYVNGMPQLMTIVSNSLTTSTLGSGVNFTIGARQGGSTGPVGTMARVRMHNRVLTPTEVADLYYDDKAVAVEGEWLMTDGTGTTLTGTQGGPNGTITTPVWSTSVPSKARRIITNIPYSLAFNAANMSVAIPNTANLTPGTSSFSCALWLNVRAAAAGDHFVLYNSASYALGWVLYRGAGTNNFSVYVKNAAASFTFIDFFAGQTSKFIRIFVTVSAVDSKIRAYRDGKLFGTSTAITAWNITATGTASLGMTAELSTGTIGDYADVSFYKGTVPTDAEVLADYLYGTQAPGCVHRYKFEEGSGTTYADSVAGNTATYFNVAPVWNNSTPSKRRRTLIDIPYSLQMLASSGYSSHGNVYDKEKTDVWSTSFWVNARTGSIQYLVGRYSAIGGWWIRYRSDTNGIEFIMQGNTGAGGSGSISVTFGALPNIGGWNHVVVAVASTKNQTRCYANGIMQVAQINIDTLVAPVLGNPVAFSLGTNAGISGLIGKMTCVRMHNRVLTAAEAKDLYYDDKAVAVDGEWLMTDGSGTTLTGTQGGPNGTITTPVWSTDTPSKKRATAP